MRIVRTGVDVARTPRIDCQTIKNYHDENNKKLSFVCGPTKSDSVVYQKQFHFNSNRINACTNVQPFRNNRIITDLPTNLFNADELRSVGSAFALAFDSSPSRLLILFRVMVACVWIETIPLVLWDHVGSLIPYKNTPCNSS